MNFLKNLKLKQVKNGWQMLPEHIFRQKNIALISPLFQAENRVRFLRKIASQVGFCSRKIIGGSSVKRLAGNSTKKISPWIIYPATHKLGVGKVSPVILLNIPNVK